MNKRLIFILLAMLLPAALLQSASASEPVSYSRPYDTQYGQTSQYYTVTFDGEGEAAVLAKLTLKNLGKTAIESILVEVPSSQVRVIYAVEESQGIRKECVRQDIKCARYAPEPQCLNWAPDGTCLETKRPCIDEQTTCLEFRDVPSYPPVYSTLDASREQLSQSTKLIFKLPVPIQPEAAASVILYYKAQGFASQSFGLWTADFETIKWGYDTEQVRVALNVQPDMHLKGQESRVSYQPSFGTMEKLSAAPAMMQAESAEMGEFSRQISYAPGYAKQTSGLDPWESFHVTAEYSESKFALYSTRYLVGGFISIAVLALLVIGVRKLWRIKLPGAGITVAVVSFLDAILVGGYIIAMPYVLEALWQTMRAEVLAVLLLVVAVLVGLFLFIAPAIWVGSKHGWAAGLGTAGATLGWMIVILLLLAALFRGTMYRTFM
ncbi:hypothetical protein HY642_03625 [Candidatus Woesearchaeota archaeon]|nr:hypothetical protein [Candidatus Woesearchaeota archaeon]